MVPSHCWNLLKVRRLARCGSRDRMPKASDFINSVQPTEPLGVVLVDKVATLIGAASCTRFTYPVNMLIRGFELAISNRRFSHASFNYL